MGVNVLNREKIRPIIEAANYLDMPDLLMELRNQEGEVYCYREPCYWLDIGRAEDYKTAIETFDTRQSEFLPE